MSRILLLLLTLSLSASLEARLFVDVNMIYRNGVDKNLILELELHSIEEVWGNRLVSLRMKNNILLEFTVDFLERPDFKSEEIGPVSKVYFKGKILDTFEEVASVIEKDKSQTSLGEVYNINYKDEEKGQLIEVSLRPYLK